MWLGPENTVGSLTGTVALVQQVIQPIAGVLEASGAVEAIKSGLNSFMEDIPWLMKSLDEVAKIHPVVTGMSLHVAARSDLDIHVVHQRRFWRLRRSTLWR